MSYQGGKAYGQLKEQQEESLNKIIENVKSENRYPDEEDLDNRLESIKKQFMEFDLDNNGEIDLMELKMMMEKLGQAKTHLELKKMIAEVDMNNSGTISFFDFLEMMLGKKSSVLKLICRFEEEMGKRGEKPTGSAPKRDLSSLP